MAQTKIEKLLASKRVINAQIAELQGQTLVIDAEVAALEKEKS